MIRLAGRDIDDESDEHLVLLVDDEARPRRGSGNTCEADDEPSLPKPSPPKPPKPAAAPAKILFLDGVRGLAAFMVVTQHSHEYMQDIDLGRCAVDAFFVLSSFLLTMLFMKKCIQMLSQDTSPRKWTFMLLDYFSKRFLRVYPLFALVATVLWWLPDDDKRRYYLIEEPQNYDLYKVLTFEFAHRYFVLWTLPLEITYYFCIPVLVIAVLRLRKFWWALVVPLYGWVVHEGWYTFRADHMELRPHTSTFLAGSLAAVVYVKLDTSIKDSSFKFQPYHIRLIRVVECFTLILLESLAFRGRLFSWIHENIAPDTPGSQFTSVLLTVIIVAEMVVPSAISTVLEWSALRYIGKVSFSVYLLHGFVVYAEWISSQPSYYDRMFWRFALTLLLATVSFHVVEKPSQKLAQSITQALRRRETEGFGARVPSPSFVKLRPPAAEKNCD